MPERISVVDFNEADRSCRITSPRSVAAARNLGIDLSELYIKPEKEHHHNAGDSKLMRRRRVERYEDKRQKKLAFVQRERQKLIAAGPLALQPEPELQPVHNPEHDHMVSALVEREKKNVAKIIKRQEFEVQQMLEFEATQLAIHEREAKKRQREEEREAARLRLKKKNAREAAEFKRRKEIQRREQEKALEDERQRQAAAYMAQQRKQAARDAQKQRQIRKEARQKEIERAEKTAHAKAETEKILQAQQEAIQERMAKMRVKDEQRIVRMEQKRKHDAIKRKAKVEQTAQRIATASEAFDKTLADQREEFAIKQAESEARRIKFEQAKEREYRQRRAAADAKSEKIKEAQGQMEHILKARIDRIEKNENETNARLRKIEVDKVRNRHVHAKQLADKQAERDQVYDQMQLEQEKKIGRIQEQRDKKDRAAAKYNHEQQMLQKTLFVDARLREEEIQGTLDRNKRIEENKKKRYLDKIERDSKKGEFIKQQQAELMHRRLQARAKATAKRELVQQQFEQIRVSGKIPKELRNQIKAASVKLASSPKSNRTDSGLNSPPKAIKSAAAPKPKPRRTKPPASAPASRTQTAPKALPPAPSETKRSKSAGAPRSKSSAHRNVVSASGKKKSSTKSAPAPRTQAWTANSREQAIQQVEALRRRQNEHLLQVLEEEQGLEEQREAMLAGLDKGQEQRRLEKIFGIERAKASERIMRITEEHEAVLAKKMVELGLS